MPKCDRCGKASNMELRDVDGFPGYKVSDDGKVWSEKTSKWLKGMPNRDGYLRIGLCVDGKHYMKLVHRLVATAFLPNPDNLTEVNHRDEDKTNNTVSNLEWCSHEYNNAYGNHNAKTKATKQHIYGKPVIQLTLNGEEVARFCCAMEAARQTGFDQGNISKVCSGERRTFKGYCWKYLPKEGWKERKL